MNKQAGIYIIKNIINKKCYVGSSTNIKRRISEHKNKLRKNNHHSQYLQNAWNKYGENNFVFEIIEIIDDIKLLAERELYWFNNLSSDYSVGHIYDNYDVLSKDIREKMSRKMLLYISSLNSVERSKKYGSPGKSNPRWKGGYNNQNLCKICNGRTGFYKNKTELCRKCYLSKLMRFQSGKYIPQSNKEYIILSNISRIFNGYSVEINGEKYTSIKDAASELGVSKETIRYRLKQKWPGYKILSNSFNYKVS